jgi:hypothetical protein
MTANKAAIPGVLPVAEEATMKDAKTYREYAADCIRIARGMNPKDRETLLKMAAAWEERARDAERAAKEADRS